MDKLKMQTANRANENFAKLAALFPNAVTETTDESGEVVRAIDKDVLMQEISCAVVDGAEERYQLTWPDKKRAILLANAPINKTLRPCPAESVDFDTTENLYLEGDNLEVLKLLQETYLGRVKMIYIDPPYNTGNDFVYNDDFTESVGEYLPSSGQFDEDGMRLVKNLDANGRFHTDWLNMIYPRLKLARDLLSDDGVIFISIDDNEVVNLRRVCDETFGADNFVTTLHVQLSTTQGMKVKAAQDGNIVKNAEYILCYAKSGKKNIAKRPLYDLREKYDEHYALYLKPDQTIGQLTELYDYRFPKDCANTKPFKLAEAYKKSPEFADIVHSHLADIVRSDKVSGYLMDKSLKNGYWSRIVRDGKEYLLTLDSKGNLQQLLRLKDSWGKTDGYYKEEGLRKIRGDWWQEFYIDMGNISKEGDMEFKNGKKPVRLIKQLAQMVTSDQDIILDFFSGSATTAHAVMQLNAEDGGHRSFIMVQLPEKTEEKSDAFKAGFRNICEIGKERIRRAAKKIAKENPDAKFDHGFRVLKCDSSNMKDVYYSPDKYDASLFSSLENNIKEDRTPEDLLFQTMLELGILLSSKIEERVIGGKKVFNVDGNYLIACFDQDVTEKAIRAIAEQKPHYFVMRDSSMASDSVATNFDQIFAAYSPETVRKVL